MKRESLPKLPSNLVVKSAYFKNSLIVIATETKEAYFEFIWDGASDSWLSTNCYLKLELE